MRPASTDLARADCVTLLRSEPVGRVVFLQNALPAVRPVAFLVDGARLVFRCTWHGVLRAALDEAVVAFEADHFDSRTRVGWSVTVLGACSVVQGTVEQDRLSATGLEPWAGGVQDRWVSIALELVEGRRVGAPQPLPVERRRGHVFLVPS